MKRVARMEFYAEEDDGGGDEGACELRKGLKASRVEYETEHAHKEGTVKHRMNSTFGV